MVSLTTPVCDFDQPAIDFELPGIDGQTWTLEKAKGNNGLLVMFIWLQLRVETTVPRTTG